ncbi:hypothetical protein FDP41_000500 [Naegleria fowleri]|uniref:Uncharacterized protein n=1 Tax=Naegleria fowleri TaxID=5763 RepID=A0A6A5CBG4_NAEFO|nr:uncharacterized protein FDP41_000500 [Naegleria fowleri]KAF0984601.1 hypothetical protein FDP41_000500 [Naegleria fowleri]
MLRPARKEDVLAFESACRRGEIGIVKELLESTIEEDRKTRICGCERSRYKSKINRSILILIIIIVQNTLLHVACIKGNLEAVSLLLEHHCDTNLQDITGKTACDLAEHRGHFELLHVIRGKDYAKKLHRSLQKHLHRLTPLTDIFFQTVE